ncbi:MAG: hypothetical protein M1375_03950 [Candidatus Thermoplasmatota archaeon]|jgi:hypothetical protein|nr:hypothetical protein [Candidatus Thermoplasmatota archaeon]MCL5791107.1 hypothetical protein [Candidatus Thermoplasmatota archaeon]
MSDEEIVKTAIEKSRKISQDGETVTYDLTSGIDFSNPKIVANAMSQLFFEKDALNWFRIKDDRMVFEPTYKVRVVLSEDDHRKMEKVVDDFLEDIKKKDISGDFSSQIRNDAGKEMTLQTAFTHSALQSVLFHHSMDKVYREEIADDIFTDLLEKLEIRSLNDKDLMDWKKLPL